MASPYGEYDGDQQVLCACGAWYGPTAAAADSHRVVFGHSPRPARAPAPPAPAGAAVVGTHGGGQGDASGDPDVDQGGGGAA